MIHRRAAALLGAGCLALTSWGGSSAAAESRKPLDVFLDNPHVSVDQAGAITLDLASGGEAAYDATMEAMAALDDRTITVVVAAPPSLSERLKQDAQLESHETPHINPNAACPPIFEMARTSRGARPDMGCNTSNGQRRAGAIVPGPLRQSVTTAVQLALQGQVADGTGVPAFRISERAGEITVNFTAGWEQFVASQPMYPGAIQETLIRTIYSDQRAKAVTLQLNGSCIDFALSMGGDVCGETRF